MNESYTANASHRGLNSITSPPDTLADSIGELSFPDSQQSRRCCDEPTALPHRPKRYLRWKKQDRRGCRTEAGNGEKAPVGPEKYTPGRARFQHLFRRRNHTRK